MYTEVNFYDFIFENQMFQYYSVLTNLNQYYFSVCIRVDKK